MALRICLVTPFAWSQPHDVNDHVAGVAAELRRLGHSVTVLARHVHEAPWPVLPWNGRDLADWAKELDGSDIVINLAGRSVAGQHNLFVALVQRIEGVEELLLNPLLARKKLYVVNQ